MPGGNLNYAFVVRDDKNAVFVKQAPDYIKVGCQSRQQAKS